jgi:hypothetical protein
MKDYKQVTDSVFKKAEQRIAEKKRRAAIIRRNAIAASGMAAALFIVLLQNDNIRSALKSLPQLASSGWSNHGSKSSHTTTAEVTTELTTTQKHTTTKTTSSETTTSETTTTETTTTTTTTTTAQKTEAPVTEAEITETTAQPTTAPPPKPSKIEGKPLTYLCSLSPTVIHASNTRLELDDGIIIDLEYGSENYIGQFKVGDEIQYNAYFVYNDEDDIYYYKNGYIDYLDAEKSIANIYDIDYPDVDCTSYKKYYDHEGAPFDGAPLMDYNTFMTYPDFCFKTDVYYRLDARKLKLIDVDGSRVTSDDGQEWQLNTMLCASDVDIYSLKPGDVISMAGDFSCWDSGNVLSALCYVIKIES